METTKQIKEVLASPPSDFRDPEGLARLMEFERRMHEAGIVKPRVYDLPLPDTVGRNPPAMFPRTRSNRPDR